MGPSASALIMHRIRNTSGKKMLRDGKDFRRNLVCFSETSPNSQNACGWVDVAGNGTNLPFPEKNAAFDQRVSALWLKAAFWRYLAPKFKNAVREKFSTAWRRRRRSR